MLLKDLPITIKSFRDSAREYQQFYDKIAQLYSPMTVSNGVAAIEVTLKAMIEEYSGYLPEDCVRHSLMKLASTCNELWMERGELKKPLISAETISILRRIAHFYEDGKYPNREKNYALSTVTEQDFINTRKAYADIIHAQKVIKKIIEAEETKEIPEE